MRRRKIAIAISLLAMAAALAAFLHFRTAEFAEFPAVARFSAATAPASNPTPDPDEPEPPTSGPPVRVAVIGGMVDTGFWHALTIRFEADTHVPIQLVASGQKDTIDAQFRGGGIDLITMHASDTIINLVADGFARDPLPWARNDMILVGPVSDPAKINGMSDVAEALRKIAVSRSKFVVHSSLGAQDVMLNIMEPRGITFDPDSTTVLFNDKQRTVLAVAAEKSAYTMLGRIPFETGRIPNSGLVVMVRGDTRLRRPFVVAVADPARLPDAHAAQASTLQRYLRSAATQAWIAAYGKGKWDDASMFFPVTLNTPATP